jgi:hypothetical protein
MTKKDKIRKTLDLSPAAAQELKELAEELELRESDVLRSGIRIIKIIREDKAQLVKPDGTRVLLVGISEYPAK